MDTFTRLHLSLRKKGWQCLERTAEHAYYQAGACNIKLANGDMFIGGQGRIALTWVQSEQRGHGTKALTQLCASFDKIGLTCDLFAEGFSNQIPQTALVAWYEKHGFIRSADYSKCQDMSRQPQKGK